MSGLVRRTLFVYGTLRRDATHPVADFLAAHATHLGGATMRGRLYALGPYPGAVTSNDAADVVVGDVFALHPETADATIARLDEYEGAEYERREIDATLASGGTVRCWMYLYTGAVDEETRIGSGDWLARREAV